MFLDVQFSAPTPGRGIVIPRSAVQSVSDRAVVYVTVVGDDTRFVERVVKLGPSSGALVEVVEGVEPGERVVAEGSFFLRAEAARTRSGG
jgi:multidrug efflux pump subunit AcrA (membrane-fusion protein)